MNVKNCWWKVRIGQKINTAALLIGFDLEKFLHFIKYMPYFVKSYYRFRELNKKSKFFFKSIQIYPLLDDIDKPAGVAFGHYFYQDLWAARKIFANQPQSHIDIGSRVDGFIAHLLTFMPVTIVDIRSLKSSISGLSVIRGDATHLSDIPDNSVESLSSLHAIEHFGLGRYGDPIDPEACFKAIRSLARVLKPAGRLYFSVPIGIEQVQFNAHRIFSPSTILNHFKDLELVSFSVVDDSGQFFENTKPEQYVNAKYACGLFEFTKK